MPQELNPVVCTYPDDSSLGYRELLDVALECCPTNEPYLVLGESFSGPIAIEIGAKKPPMLKGIILVNTFVICPHPYLAKIAALLPGPALSKPPDMLLKYLLQEKESGTGPLLTLKAVLRSLDSEVIRSRLSSILAVDVRTVTPDIETDICVIQSKNDMAIPRSARRLLLDCLNLTEAHQLPGNHFGLQTYPATASRIIAEFLPTTC